MPSEEEPNQLLRSFGCSFLRLCITRHFIASAFPSCCSLYGRGRDAVAQLSVAFVAPAAGEALRHGEARQGHCRGETRAMLHGSHRRCRPPRRAAWRAASPGACRLLRHEVVQGFSHLVGVQIVFHDILLFCASSCCCLRVSNLFFMRCILMAALPGLMCIRAAISASVRLSR